MDFDFSYGLRAPPSCLQCGSKSSLLRCGGCKVVSYCGAAHQTAHRSTHNSDCNAITNTRETLEREEAALRAQPGDIMMPADIFNSSRGVGNFWGIWGTRDYMRARFAAANALLRIDTSAAVEQALAHFTDMIRLNENDNMGVRDIIPALMLRLDKEQECYDFLKQWALVDDNGNVPPLNVGADVFEPVDFLPTEYCPLSLSQLVSLTLLKLRLYLDLSALEVEPEPDRPIGKLARARCRSLLHRGTLEQTVEKLKDQYQKLCTIVHEANPHFWELLTDESLETPAPPASYEQGSIEEAHLALYQCKQSWEESEDAILMIDSDTAALATVYKSPPNVATSGPAAITAPEKRRGTGQEFPSLFTVGSTTLPHTIFSATRVDRSQAGRFVSRHDNKKVLVYTDGACVNNGQPNPRGGWAVVYGPQGRSGERSSSTVSGRLEDKGPFGDIVVATNNRAELRAAISALRLCNWRADGFDSIVIATDSSYVAEGATSWAKAWIPNRWRTRSGKAVVNRDLWELLLGEVERWSSLGLRVEMWNIPRELNVHADAAAKAAANKEPLPVFRDIFAADNGAVAGGAQPAPGNISVASSQVPTGPLRIVGLCLENEDLFLACHGALVASIAAKTNMERAVTPASALAMLDRNPPPTTIIDTDGSLLHHKKVLQRVIDLLRGGATVILAGTFSSSVNQGQFDRLFATIGLPWTRGGYHRTTQELQRDAVGDQLAQKLPAACSQKALYVKNVDRSAIWYIPDDSPNEAAAVFAKVGLGRLGYVGDVNGEDSSNMVVMAMCGLLD